MKNKSLKNLRGLFYILVSFIPWILYWILCGVGNSIGLVISFLISLILIAPQVHKKDFNPMDVASVAFFGIANVLKFIFNVNVFIEKSGFLGYSASE